MAKQILHLRGSKDEYERYGVRVGDGELALERREGAPTRIKIGDGKTPYGDLPYFGKNLRTVRNCANDRASIVLSADEEIRVGLHGAYELILPEKIEEDYECSLFFYTSIRSPSFTYPSRIVFLGDACEGGLFRPEASTAYMIDFKLHDDTVYASVTGAPLKLAYESYSQIEQIDIKSPAAIIFRDKKNLLDISFGGNFLGGDTDGYVSGLGSYDYDNEIYAIDFEAYNAHLFDFSELLGSALRYKTTLTTTESEEGFYITVKTNTQSSIIVNTMLRPASKTQYRIRCGVRLDDEAQTPVVGHTMPSPFSVRYSDGATVKLTMTAQEDGSYLVNTLSDANRTILYFYFTAMDQERRVEILEDGFAFCAEFEGIEPPPYAQTVKKTVFLNSPLLSAENVRDTLSLSTMTITRRIYANFIENIKVHSTAGDYTVFYLTLPVAMAKGGAFTVEDFERIDDPEMLPYTPYSFAVDETEGKLLITGGEDQSDIDSMLSYLLYDLESTCYAYERETPIIEKNDCELDFRHYENYMVLRYTNAINAHFIITQYTEKEGDSNVREMDQP